MGDRIFSQPERKARWPWVILASVLTLAAVGLALWLLWLPHYRPGLHAGERYGVDVSNHQQEIDWDAVAGDNISFAIIKATEGGDFVDPFFADNLAGARAAGLDIGAYHFFTLCKPGAEQAANFLSIADVASMELPVGVNLELAGNCADRPSQQWVDAELAIFLREVEVASGRPAMLYVGDRWERQYDTKDTWDRPLWQRRNYRRPVAADSDWVVWQYSGESRVDGVNGDVDMNVMRPGVAAAAPQPQTPAAE